MSNGTENILLRVQRKWRSVLGVQILLYAIGLSVLAYFLGLGWFWTILAFAVAFLWAFVLIKPWRLQLPFITRFIDATKEKMEYSTGLLLQNEGNMGALALLQRKKITELSKEELKDIVPMGGLKRAGIVLLGSIMVGSFIHYSGIDLFENATPNKTPEQSIIFHANDSSKVKETPPLLVEQRVSLVYPSYTNRKAFTSTNMSIRALEGSSLSWRLKFDKEVDSVFLQLQENRLTMLLKDGYYVVRSRLKEPAFYSFKFVDKSGNSYSSDLYSLESFKDEEPEIKIKGLSQFSTFDFDDIKQLKFQTAISDDFGVETAHIIATVSKGSGESVKFREEKLFFDGRVPKGRKKIDLSKHIDLDELKMDPGDELYFHIEAIDQKLPTPNVARSETFFVVVRDTAPTQFAVEGTLGADLMPDYFRSQRQLIIDTEKLIRDKSRLTEKEFNFTSNELGYDQKALRLKYGEFMGDEADSGLQIAEEPETPVAENATDPLADFTHDHDGANEHNLVDHEHEEEEEGDQKEDPLEAYLHNHDDPEESTLFTQSLKGKLRQAMAEMWDAELHLRLYTPEKSLPYQYRALKLIQEIKNSARIYVHRIGFDPPPIKEDKRLTGDIDEVGNYRKQADIADADPYPNMRYAVARLELLVAADQMFSEEDRTLFEKAGNELAELAIKEPSKHLKTLQELKYLTEQNTKTEALVKNVQKGLLLALPNESPDPKKSEHFNSELNELLLRELESDDR